MYFVIYVYFDFILSKSVYGASYVNILRRYYYSKLIDWREY